MKIAVILSFMFVLGISCSEDPINEKIVLSIDDLNELSSDLTIGFTDVIEDSRCPANVECVWEGRAVVELSLLREGDVLYSFQLIDHANNEEVSDTIIGEVYIKLLGVNPYPQDPGDIQREDYSIQLLVEERE